jgi:hypothetical protein
MNLNIIFAGFSLIVITACGGSADIDSAVEAENKKESVFSGYLSAVDKAKAAQQATNDRQRQLDATLGFDDSSATGQHTLGIVDPGSAPENGDSSGDGSVFDGAVTSMNKARSTRDMLNNRQRKLDAMWGVEPQSASHLDKNDEPSTNVERPTAEEGMLTIVDRAKQIQQSANERERNLEATWGIESQSAR